MYLDLDRTIDVAKTTQAENPAVAQTDPETVRTAFKGIGLDTSKPFSMAVTPRATRSTRRRRAV